MWRAWHKRVDAATDLESVLHSIVSNTLQAAAPWAPEASVESEESAVQNDMQ